MAERNSRLRREVADEFELELPSELQIEPKWTVELPGKHTASIFDDTWKEQHRRNGDYEDVTMTGYRLVVRKRTGRIVEINGYRYGGDGSRFTSLLTLKLVLDDLVYQLKPKSRTTVERDDYDD